MLLGLTLTLIPYVYLIQYLVSPKGWFIPLALPITIISLVAFAISMVALTNKNINKFYAIAITILLFGVVVNIGVAILVYRYLNENIIFDIYRVTTISIALVAALIFIIIGYSKGKPEA